MSILSVAEAASLLRNRQVSPVELTREALERASRLNPTSHCFITIDAEASLEQARLAEEEIGKGKYRGGLHGIPVSLKDNLDTAALRNSATASHDPESLTAAVSYDTAYAARQHEELTWHHRTGQAKFLESALASERDTVARLIQAQILKALGE